MLRPDPALLPCFQLLCNEWLTNSSAFCLYMWYSVCK
jgi:hypothetical protein